MGDAETSTYRRDPSGNARSYCAASTAWPWRARTVGLQLGVLNWSRPAAGDIPVGSNWNSAFPLAFVIRITPSGPSTQIASVCAAKIAASLETSDRSFSSRSRRAASAFPRGSTPKRTDPDDEVVAQPLEHRDLCFVERVRLRRVEAEGAEGLAGREEGQAQRRLEAVPLRPIPPRREGLRLLEVPQQGALAGADRDAGRSAAPLPLSPGDPQTDEVGLEARLRDRTHRPRGVVFGEADPREAVPADLHGHPADPREELGLVLRPQQHLVALGALDARGAPRARPSCGP